MSSKNIGILIAVAAAIVIIAAAAFFMSNGGNGGNGGDDKEVTPVAKILIEDQDGVYFWTQGSGSTIADCLGSASPGVTVTMTDSSFGKYVGAINGLAADGNSYWAIYSYKDGAWKMSDLGASSMKTKENPVVGFFYVTTESAEPYGVVAGGPGKVTVPAVSSAKVWDGRTDGTIFCIQGMSGMYFYISDATGTTMTERFKAATTAYGVPFEESKRGGISSLFGKGSVPKTDSEGNPMTDPETGSTVYNYWAQFGLVRGVWDYMSTGLASTKADDYSQMAIVYGDGGMGSAFGLTAPVYPVEGRAVATILVEDQNGVRFWAEGSGETIADCLAGASPGVTFTMTDSSFGKYVSAINGLAADGNSYWCIYSYKGGDWIMSDLGVSSMKTRENPVVGFFYVTAESVEPYVIVAGGPDKVDVPSISSAKVWDGKTDGTIFCIQSMSGLYFYINDNTGPLMSDRFRAATTAYGVPFDESSYGISSLFGIASAVKTDSEGNPMTDPETGYTVYNYWAQFGLKDGAWSYMDTTLPNTNAADFAQMAIVYGDGGMGSASGLTAPVYVG